MQSQVLLYAAAGATTTGPVLGMALQLFSPNVMGFALHQSYGAASSGSWKIEISLDPVALTDTSSAVWHDATTDFALTDPSAAGAANELVQYEGKFLAIQATFTKVAGTNPITLWLMR